MSDDRVKTMLRIPKSLHERLTQAAEERYVSVNWLACQALDDFLSHLIPADELRLTNDGEIEWISIPADSADMEALREAANHMWDSREALQRWQALASDLAGSVIVALDE